MSKSITIHSKRFELTSEGRWTPSLTAYGLSLQHTLEAARKRKGYSSDPKREARDIAEAQAAIEVFAQTMAALIEDGKLAGLK